MMKKLQKLGSALMLPVAVLPIAGILMGLGYVLCPAFMMGAEWAASLGHATSGVAHTIGWLMITAGNALIGAMAELFVLGVSIGLAKDNNGTA
ncbi:MAG: PTS transporter subunit EIIC, partial [Clostridia bacterium]|nr:PTS transporter subunit EIIC [Clostridia bacterium]